MRTTLDIDEDVLTIARQRAARDRRSVGQALSEMARKGAKPERAVPQYRNGIRLMPVSPGAGRATLELVNQLRDETE